ncbi:hypothetical protein GGP91_001000 [Salinibacter ruber]|uniref:hypothetical protein n=1 Tax=Salinibacter ruber TaxID=146919 RepID=UPI0020744A1B|nr:hypothetical protein [Salinibacter ruber]MCS3828941.1 hypothetical protein [Salinibacter ruber]MCS4056310.1 hypothetical protein [Salinibacter ruber]MCS4059689.1 hypothetical protein [Salinibacter ruber]MCS4160999.1 hypothetical protein [Salinibacter ruber]
MTRSALLRSRLAPLALAVALVVAVTGCDSTGPSTSGGGEVQVGFSTASSSSPSSTTALAKAASDPLVLSGPNGDSLDIHDIRLIVDKVKLEQDSDDDAGSDGTEVEIEREVEVERPSFLDLPLQESEISPVAAGDVPEGTYNEFEFEVDDLDDDEGNARALLSEIRNGDEFPNWPEDASMVVVGTFTPADGTPTSFTAYFAAEIEVERELQTPIEVTGEGFSRQLVVRLDPARWFKGTDGSPRDLSRSDFEQTDTVVEFEAEFEEGVSDIEFD